MRKKSKEEKKEYYKAWRESHKEYFKDYRKSHQKEIRAYNKVYRKDDVNSTGQTKQSIRHKSSRFLAKYGKKIPGYQIHHCCTYDEPYKFIYCPKEMHLLIHAYLKKHNIDADSEHYEQIKHLLDDTVVFYGIEKGDK